MLLENKINNPLLSVIIPCYNSGRVIIDYLEEIEEDFADLLDGKVEFVIIDDCSRDSSLESLVFFQNHTSLSLSIHENDVNVGPGISRNKGLLISSGYYVTFLDSDDCFSNTFFKTVLKLLDDNIDCVVFNYIEKTGKKEINKSIFLEKTNKNNLFDIIVNIKGSPWGKVYKKSLIVDNHVCFSNSYIGEDMPFTKAAISFCSQIIVLDDCLYVYNQSDDSLMHNHQIRKVADYLSSFDLLSKNINILFRSTLVAIFYLEVIYETCFKNSIRMSKNEWLSLVKELSDYSIVSSGFKKLPQSIKHIKRLILRIIVGRHFYITRMIAHLFYRI